MRKQYLDRTGVRYGRLIAISPIEQFTSTGTRKWAWKCKCDCGKEIITRADNLGNSETKSCGCYKCEINKITIEYTRGSITKHGDSARDKMNDIYKLYHCIKGRVNCNRERDARNYKNRGIDICDEWKNDYLSFKKWALNHGYKKGLQIDRINNDIGYQPDNCRFVTQKENAMNKRTNKYLTYNNETKIIAEWIKLSSIKSATFRSRLRGGWSIEKILTTPVSS